MIKEKNEMMVFSNEEFGEVRVITLNGVTYFNLEDVCFKLGYVKKNSMGKEYLRKDLIVNIAENLDIKGVSAGDTKIIRITKQTVFDECYISEDDLYDFILESKAKNARSFRKWITGEVIPTIKNTGGYVQKGKEREFIANYFPTFSDSTKLAMVSELQEQNDKMKMLIQEQSKSVAFVKLVSETTGTKSMKEFADSLGIRGLGRNNLYDMLRELGIVLNNDTIPYRKYIESGHLTVNQTVVCNGEIVCSTRVTPKGEVWLTKKILKHLDNQKIFVSEDAMECAKEVIIGIQHRSEEELKAMCIHPQLFLDDWDGVSEYVKTTGDDDLYMEIQEMISEY